MPSNLLILCRPLLLPSSNFPSIRVFSNESVLCIRWPKYWSFSFNISHSNEYSALISFRMDWLDLLASKALSRVFSNTTVQKLWSQNSLKVESELTLVRNRSPRDSQESSPTPQFKIINQSLVLSFLDSPTLTSIHDHWKNHSFD